MRAMEHYCQNAEYLHGEGKPVPAFCVGVTLDGDAGIITEDVTAGGEFELEHPPESAIAYVVDGKAKREVYLDIDGTYRFTWGMETRYFLEEHRIDL